MFITLLLHYANWISPFPGSSVPSESNLNYLPSLSRAFATQFLVAFPLLFQPPLLCNSYLWIRYIFVLSLLFYSFYSTILAVGRPNHFLNATSLCPCTSHLFLWLSSSRISTLSPFLLARKGTWKENGSVSLKLWCCRKVCCIYQSEPGGTSHNSIAQPSSKSCPPCFLIFPHIVPKSYWDHSWLPLYVNRERYSSSNLTSLPTGTLEIIFPILLHLTLCFVLFFLNSLFLTNIYFLTNVFMHFMHPYTCKAIRHTLYVCITYTLYTYIHCTILFTKYFQKNLSIWSSEKPCD